MADIERVVAGLRCRDVLDRLSDYLDGDLAPGDVAAVDAHLRGCAWCERFGGEFAATVTDLRRQLETPTPLPAGMAERLRQRLRVPGGPPS